MPQTKENRPVSEWTPKQAICGHLPMRNGSRRRLGLRGSCLAKLRRKKLADELIAERLDLPRRAQQTRRLGAWIWSIAMRRAKGQTMWQNAATCDGKIEALSLFGALIRQH